MLNFDVGFRHNKAAARRSRKRKLRVLVSRPLEEASANRLNRNRLEKDHDHERNWPILFALLLGLFLGIAWGSRRTNRIEAKEGPASAESEIDLDQGGNPGSQRSAARSGARHAGRREPIHERVVRRRQAAIGIWRSFTSERLATICVGPSASFPNERTTPAARSIWCRF